MQGEPVQGLRSLDDGFIPPIIDLSLLDRKIFVTNRDAIVWTRRLLDEEGIFAGVSSGAIASIAVRIANEMDEGNVVFIVCDDGWKYLSSRASTRGRSTRSRTSTPPSGGEGGLRAYGSERTIAVTSQTEASMPNVGPLELVVVLVIALIVLGPEEAARGRALRSGKGMREFKDSLSGEHDATTTSARRDLDAPRQPDPRLALRRCDRPRVARPDRRPRAARRRRTSAAA